MTAADFQGKIYFYGGQHFSHLAICIAEGLRALGVDYAANQNSFLQSLEPEDWLFRYDPRLRPESCQVIVFDQGWQRQHRRFPDLVTRGDRQWLTVYLDDMDGPTIWNRELDDFDLRLRTHFSQSNYPSNCTAWAFGLSNRIIQATSSAKPFAQRRTAMLLNYRVDQERLEMAQSWIRTSQGLLRVDRGVMLIDYPLRRIARERILPLSEALLPLEIVVDEFDAPPSEPLDFLLWQQTGMRHYPAYYQRLGQVVACACFAGCLVADDRPSGWLATWWDSWRFWESLAAGCVAFHVDFDRYGVQLPVMPENGRHYIGVDLDCWPETIERLKAEPEQLATIGAAGRMWAIEHYGPIPTAKRFLEWINVLMAF